MFHTLLLSLVFVSTWSYPFLLPVDAGHPTEKRRKVNFLGKTTWKDQAGGKMLQVRSAGFTFSQRYFNQVFWVRWSLSSSKPQRNGKHKQDVRWVSSLWQCAQVSCLRQQSWKWLMKLSSTARTMHQQRCCSSVGLLVVWTVCLHILHRVITAERLIFKGKIFLVFLWELTYCMQQFLPPLPPLPAMIHASRSLLSKGDIRIINQTSAALVFLHQQMLGHTTYQHSGVCLIFTWGFGVCFLSIRHTYLQESTEF